MKYEITNSDIKKKYTVFYSDLGCSDNEIQDLLNQINLESSFDCNIAKEKLYLYRKSKCSFAIVVPTSNRIEEIKYWILTLADDMYINGYDLIFYDSSSDDNYNKTKEIINNSGYHNLEIKRYDQEVNGVLCNKVYSAAKEVGNLYDYTWIIRDRSIPNLEVVLPKIQEVQRENADFCVVYPHWLPPMYYGQEWYTDGKKLARDFCGEMTSLGSLIFSKKVITTLVDEFPVDQHTNYGMWIPISLFHYIAKYTFKAFYFGNNSFTYLPYSGSFWIKNSSLSWLFINRWNEMIDLLPEYYNPIKEQLRKYKGWRLPPFANHLVIQSRASGDLNPLCVIKNYKELKRCTEINQRIKICICSLVPRNVFLYYIHKPNLKLWKCLKWVYKIIIVIYKMSKNIVQTLNSTFHFKKYSQKYSGIDYSQNENAFKKKSNIKSYLRFGTQREDIFLSIIIPTMNRLDYLKDALKSISMLDDVGYNWEVIVIDNDSYDGKENETEKYIKTLNIDNLIYFRNEANLGAGGNMNRGVELSKGKWVSFLHDDDMLYSDFLIRIEALIHKCNNKNGVGMIFADQQVVKFHNSAEDKNSIKSFAYYNYENITKNNKYDCVQVTGNQVVYTGDLGLKSPTVGFTYLKEAFMKGGGFNEEKYGVTADMITDSIILTDYSAYMCKVPFGIYRWGDNESSKKTREIVTNLYDFREYKYRQTIFGTLMKGMLRQEHTRQMCQVMGQLDAKEAESAETCYSLIKYYPNFIRSAFVKFVKKIYIFMQNKTKI